MQLEGEPSRPRPGVRRQRGPVDRTYRLPAGPAHSAWSEAGDPAYPREDPKVATADNGHLKTNDSGTSPQKTRLDDVCQWKTGPGDAPAARPCNLGKPNNAGQERPASAVGDMKKGTITHYPSMIQGTVQRDFLPLIFPCPLLAV